MHQHLQQFFYKLNLYLEYFIHAGIFSTLSGFFHCSYYILNTKKVAFLKIKENKLEVHLALMPN